MAVHPHAGKLPAPETLENIPALVSAYYTESPDLHQAAQRVFGNVRHRGSSLKQTFNERHIHAITQAVCRLPQTTRHHRSAVHGRGYARPVGTGLSQCA